MIKSRELMFCIHIIWSNISNLCKVFYCKLYKIQMDAYVMSWNNFLIGRDDCRCHLKRFYLCYSLCGYCLAL